MILFAWCEFDCVFFVCVCVLIVCMGPFYSNKFVAFFLSSVNFLLLFLLSFLGVIKLCWIGVKNFLPNLMLKNLGQNIKLQAGAEHLAGAQLRGSLKIKTRIRVIPLAP